MAIMTVRAYDKSEAKTFSLSPKYEYNECKPNRNEANIIRNRKIHLYKTSTVFPEENARLGQKGWTYQAKFEAVQNAR